MVIAAVGRMKEPHARAWMDDYVSRIRRYATIEERELREAGEARLVSDVEALLRATGPRARLCALDVDGREYTSAALAERIRGLRDDGSVPVFLLGAAQGLPTQLRARAAEKLSLSRMTLPHKLARVVLAEQIYRAFTILSGEPYPR